MRTSNFFTPCSATVSHCTPLSAAPPSDKQIRQHPFDEWDASYQPPLLQDIEHPYLRRGWRACCNFSLISATPVSVLAGVCVEISSGTGVEGGGLEYTYEKYIRWKFTSVILAELRSRSRAFGKESEPKQITPAPLGCVYTIGEKEWRFWNMD